MFVLVPESATLPSATLSGTGSLLSKGPAMSARVDCLAIRSAAALFFAYPRRDKPQSFYGALVGSGSRQRERSGIRFAIARNARAERESGSLYAVVSARLVSPTCALVDAPDQKLLQRMQDLSHTCTKPGMSSGSATSSRRPSAAEPTGTTADFDVDFSYVYSIPTPTPSGALATPTSYPHDGRFLGLESSSARREERLLHQGEEMSAIDWANDLLSRFPDGSDAPPMPWEVPSKPIGGGPDAGTVIGQACFSGVGFGFGGGEPAGDLFGEALRTAPWSNLR